MQALFAAPCAIGDKSVLIDADTSQALKGSMADSNPVAIGRLRENTTRMRLASSTNVWQTAINQRSDFGWCSATTLDTSWEREGFMKKILFLLLGCLAMAGTVHAQARVTATHRNGLIEGYRAYIGQADLFNSNGVRLTQPWQIIRQDRANFHQYGVRDRDDESDSFFGDPVNRQALEEMLRNGTMTRDAANMIVRGNVWIDVNIYGGQGTGRWIDVSVSD
jgi:hypothetical protein